MKQQRWARTIYRLRLVMAVVTTLVLFHMFLFGQVTPNDSAFTPNQWSLHNTGQTGGTSGADIKATLAWAITTGDTNVVIAILDSGIPLTTNKTSPVHPELRKTNRIIMGPDCIYHETSMDWWNYWL